MKTTILTLAALFAIATGSLKADVNSDNAQTLNALNNAYASSGITPADMLAENASSPSQQAMYILKNTEYPQTDIQLDPGCSYNSPLVAVDPAFPNSPSPRNVHVLNWTPQAGFFYVQQ